ncbi:P pilus assembly/Cpx signaling pathway, periplasmic inhibitor/zinc-resistance associated protein [Trichocoleus sp. FACHB-262]|uniref:P pilus assembly/Cpx signaling pathway, periplasmic inhibitor/zinc-resistance associated protein n=1 Tax=Trichocoleus sp. FACHB-262 TaxID=2692869 RepID=UPI001686E03F|nr:P pilus assembly/Cpx signaling pathway, periplasmic inhibitor/zinc-resistance associated protein [Trichocoleus sp. FACHB-262]MBD2121749.1 P pilus assembly/Cpx signaling pathway, periplasmic inhibitor/zinc-resistance associated protein [Trichocoleus sp. FACHB-262]
MKLKLIPLLAGAIAMTLAAAPLATQVVQAQSNTGTPSQSGHRMKGMKGMNTLNLSAEQRAQMQQIHEATKAQIEQVLTAEQRQQLEAAKEQRQATRAERRAAREGQARPQGETRERRGPFANLNLSAEQQTRIQEIRQASRQRMEAVLTEEQRQKLNELKQTRQQVRQGQQQ